MLNYVPMHYYLKDTRREGSLTTSLVPVPQVLASSWAHLEFLLALAAAKDAVAAKIKAKKVAVFIFEIVSGSGEDCWLIL